MSTPSNNYAPPQSVVADVGQEAGTFEKATRGSRLAAALLDGIIFSIPLLPIYGVAMSSYRRHGPADVKDVVADVLATGWYFSVGMLVNLVLLIVMAVMVHRTQQTYGKRIMKIKVARKDGSRASLGRIFWLRNIVNGLIGLVPFIGAFYPLVDILFIFGEAKRCVHDYIADTIVVRA